MKIAPIMSGTPGEIVLPFQEPAGIDYLDAPMHVTATPDGSRTVYEATLDHPSLNPAQFHAFLREVSPSMAADSPAGINADWDIVDRAADAGYAKNLVDLHTHLGSAWEDFMPSRPIFMRVMADAVTPYFGREHGVTTYMRLGNLVPEASISVSGLVTEAARQRGRDIRVLEEVVAESGVDDPRALVLASLQTAVNKRRKANLLSNPDKITRQFNKLSDGNRQAILQGIVEALPEEQQQLFVEAAKADFYQSVELEDGVRYFVPNGEIDCDLVDAVENARTVRQGRFEAKVAQVAIKNRYSGYRTETHGFVLPGSVKSVEPVSTIRPKLTWTKDKKGNRNFLIAHSDIEVSDAAQDYEDGVLGVLLSAYLAPEVRRKWATSMSIRGSRKQQIGPAQVPVLALFPAMRQQLLNSSFIKAAEAQAA